MTIYPYQIDELIGVHGDIELSALRTAVLTGKEFTCPQCTGDGRIANPDTDAASEEPLILCPTCEGLGKTEVEYEAYCLEEGYREIAPEPEEP